MGGSVPILDASGKKILLSFKKFFCLQTNQLNKCLLTIHTYFGACFLVYPTLNSKNIRKRNYRKTTMQLFMKDIFNRETSINWKVFIWSEAVLFSWSGFCQQ